MSAKEDRMRIAVGVMAVFVIAAGVVAQPLSAPRTILQRVDASVKGHEAIASVANFEAGASTSWHTHPGEMVGYVVRGTIVVEIQGQPTVTRRAGESIIIPARVAHRDTASPDGPAQMFASYFVEKGQPLNGQP
jgi:quercetin dioxygenase-like cupin family protein